MTIDWDELTQRYNEQEATSHSTPREMREDLYVNQKLPHRKMQEILDVSRSAIIIKLKEDGIKMRARGGKHNSPGLIEKTFLEIPEQEMKNMSSSKLTGKLNCSRGYLDRLVKSHHREYMK